MPHVPCCAWCWTRWRTADRRGSGIAVSRPARARADTDRWPTSGNDTSRRSRTAMVPVRPVGSSRVTQAVRVAEFSTATRRAAAHGSVSSPMRCAPASATRSATASARCRASTASAWMTATPLIVNTRARKPSSQIVADPRSVDRHWPGHRLPNGRPPPNGRRPSNGRRLPNGRLMSQNRPRRPVMAASPARLPP